MTEGVLELSLSEAFKHNMPPIGFSVDWVESGMRVEKFPDSGTYLSLSRPPQGIFELTVHPYRSESHDVKALENLINDYYTDSKYHRVRLGNAAYLDLDNVRRHAIMFETGFGITRRIRCGALVPSPDGGPYGLLVVFGKYDNGKRIPKKPQEVLTTVNKRLADSFRLHSSR